MDKVSQTNRNTPRYPGVSRGEQRPARPARRYTGPAIRAVDVGEAHFRRDLGRICLGGLIALLLAFFLQIVWPDGFPLSVNQKINGKANAITEIHASGAIRLNEIMTSNRYTLLSDEDEAADWIEIMNTGRSGVNLSGYRLTKSVNSATAFTFPEMVLEPGACVVVYADSRIREKADQPLHAPFRLSSGGDTLLLCNPGGTAVDTVNIPAMKQDTSYTRLNKNTWIVVDTPTPGMENTMNAYNSLTTDDPYSPVILVEIMSRNRSALSDSAGRYSDYIILYNRSTQEVSVNGWYLSDDSMNRRKWKLPDETIPSGGTLIVYADKLDEGLHTNFALKSEGEEVILSNSEGKRMDSVRYGILGRDEAYARAQDNTWHTGVHGSYLR